MRRSLEFRDWSLRLLQEGPMAQDNAAIVRRFTDEVITRGEIDRAGEDQGDADPDGHDGDDDAARGDAGVIRSWGIGDSV
jgi:hypothetical protein